MSPSIAYTFLSPATAYGQRKNKISSAKTWRTKAKPEDMDFDFNKLFILNNLQNTDK
jgi:hypothetical protein